MVKLRYSILLIAAFSCIAQSTHPMFRQRYQQFKQNFGPAVTLGALGGVATFAQYSTTYAICKDKGLVGYASSDRQASEKRFEKLPAVSPDIETFIREELKDYAFPLQIKQSTGDWASCDTKNSNWIFVPSSSFLESILNESKKSAFVSQNLNETTATLHHEAGHIANQDNLKTKLSAFVSQILNETIATLHHEAGHIVNHDNLKRKFAAIAIPIFLTALTALVRKKLFSPDYFLESNLYKLVSGFAVGNISTLSFYSYLRFQEQRADNNIPNKIDLLEALKKQFESDILLNPDFYKKDELWTKRLYSVHPHHKTRIKRFEQRIKKLKEKENQTSFENPLDIKEASLLCC